MSRSEPVEHVCVFPSRLSLSAALVILNSLIARTMRSAGFALTGNFHIPETYSAIGQIYRLLFWLIGCFFSGSKASHETSVQITSNNPGWLLPLYFIWCAFKRVPVVLAWLCLLLADLWIRSCEPIFMVFWWLVFPAGMEYTWRERVVDGPNKLQEKIVIFVFDEAWETRNLGDGQLGMQN